MTFAVYRPRKAFNQTNKHTLFFEQEEKNITIHVLHLKIIIFKAARTAEYFIGMFMY